MAMLSKTSFSLLSSLSPKPKLIYRSDSFLLSRSSSTVRIAKKKKEKAKAALAKEKRRTRSDKEFNKDAIIERCYVEEGDSNTNNTSHHIPVMLAEVLDVFSNKSLTSFVDCTLGAAGHSTAVIRSHPELKYFVGMDVDPVAHDKAQPRINAVLHDSVEVFTVLRNFRHIKSVLRETGDLQQLGFDGILMDLGMSSMQVDNPQRGFSVLGDGPLDMRMDPQACDRQVLKLKTY